MVKPKKPQKAADDTRKAAEEILSLMLTQGKMQWGNAVKSLWFYDGELCPGCMPRPTGTFKIKGK